MNKAFDIPLALDRVEISNFRLFGELKAVLHPQLTVFIAPNSGGKTALLDAIAGTLEGFTQPDNFDASFQESDVKKGVTLSSYKTKKVTILNGTKLILNVQSDYLNLWKLDRYKNTINPIEVLAVFPSTPHIVPQGLISWKENQNQNYYSSQLALQFSNMLQVAFREKISLPLIAYFSANRRVVTSGSVSFSQEFDLSRKQAYLGLLPCSNLDDFAPWLRERAITGLETRLEMEETGQINKPTPDEHLVAVSTVLALMLEKEVGVKTVKYFSSSKSIQAVKENGERFDIDQLSHGAKSVLMIAAKLAMHCCALNPHLRDQAPALTSGIILIDEIDLHLHPRWQQHVIADLQQCFPKMQFIISTHSPAILSTVKKENIRVIDIDDATGKSSATEPLARSYGSIR